jgi:hypothetical protein
MALAVGGIYDHYGTVKTGAAQWRPGKSIVLFMSNWEVPKSQRDMKNQMAVASLKENDWMPHLYETSFRSSLRKNMHPFFGGKIPLSMLVMMKRPFMAIIFVPVGVRRLGQECLGIILP